MAIVEAASCGLQVVSTRVGGIPEVLPSELIHLTDATVDSLHQGLLSAINKLKQVRSKGQSIDSTTSHPTSNKENRILCPYECNEILRKLYNWNDITRRTELVYQRVRIESDPPFGEKLKCYLKTCIPFVLVVSFSYLFLKFLDIIVPRRYIDTAIEPKHINIPHQTTQKKHKHKRKKYY